ncbi:cysteinyl-tRNA synthetase [Megavirus lba]|uniref:Cysteinyl-tRNA synthetase n=1 Tax=Megavirus lba TaxID=1235314 RepID=L7Y4R1_9VIRU|nr:cysteinyl-tRNA synthetase [Megavirus lba]
MSNTIQMYVCGPTVYNDSHIGHARIYVMVDIINRTMTNILNQDTHLVMNITDIDDKIIKAANNQSVSWQTLSKKYEDKFFESMAKLGVAKPDVVIRVSESIDDIIKYIQQIINNDFAYVTFDGSVYFDTIKYVNAGYILDCDIDIEEQTYESQIASEIINEKRHIKDFALWKSRADYDVGFFVEFIFNNAIIKTYGVPGWHIECSAMIERTIGDSVNIHFGGIDLKFPHHHNECLQANAYYHPKYKPNTNINTEKWTQEFMHVGHLCVEGQKMSKSLKNFSTIDEVLETVNSNEMRWMFMQNNWRKPMEFNNGVIEHAKNFNQIINNFLNRTANYPFNIMDIKYSDNEIQFKKETQKNISNISNNLSKFEFHHLVNNLIDLISKTNIYLDKPNPNESVVKKITNYILNLITQLGFNYETNNSIDISNIMKVIVETRTDYRKITRNKNISKDVKNEIFNVLDSERNLRLPSIGISLEDTRDSSSWYTN